MNVILSTILPIALIIIIGFIANKKLDLNQSTLSKTNLYILVPALVIDSLSHTTISSEVIFKILGGYALISLICYGLISIVCHLKKIKKEDYKSLLASILVPNNGNMGLPIVIFALGDIGLERAIIYMIGGAIFLFIIAPAILQGKGFKIGLQLTFKLPLIWAMLLGFLLNWFNLELPFNLGKSIKLLGAAAIPLALLILGMQLSRIHFKISKSEIFTTITKLAIAPMIAYVVAILLKLEGLDFQVLILQTAMPTAVNSLIMVKEFGGNEAIVARTIVFSTLMSFITLPIVIWLIN